MDLSKSKVFSELSQYRKLPLLSKLVPTSIETPSKRDLNGFKASQRIAYNCAVEAAQRLEVGMTEREIAAWMHQYLHDHGVAGGFHRPLAWFGERTRFEGVKTESEAYPTERKLTSDTEPVIIDIAPIYNNYVSDIGFAFTKAPNPALIEAREFLLELRDKVADLFSTDMSVAEIWAEIDEIIKDRGYQNCHKKYVMSVLGHRVYRLPSSWPGNFAGMYSVQAIWSLASRGFFPELLSPYHKGEKIGMWALEPHIGNREENFGVKFEEILVVEEGHAYWLQDDVPHVQLPEGLY